MYSYGMVCCTCIGISSLLGRRLCWILRPRIYPFLLRNCNFRYFFGGIVTGSSPESFDTVPHSYTVFKFILILYSIVGLSQSWYIFYGFSTKSINQSIYFHIFRACCMFLCIQTNEYTVYL